MWSQISFAVAVIFAAAYHSSAAAEEFLVQLEQYGYTRSSAAEPRDERMRGMELLVQLDKPFHNKVTVGNEVLTLSGKLTIAPEGKYRLNVRHHLTIDTGTSVVVGDGREQRILDETSFQTTLAMKLDEAIMAGGKDTSTKDAAGDVKSKTRFQVKVVKYVPSEE
jgi:hypothetical protein